ncbi:MBOAT family protein [Parasphingopyxis sp. CP4]|uniref:MBOAT family protein n=1 Tax=Parasphingopyxis sp. CP4 TaxID=2724527 RepID=UPI001C40B08F|nr:MBOAT family protein [Parasphingopyxis sp. CP4]
MPLGANGALQNMLQRSFGAGSFAGFWRYWNPIFGYYLGRYVYRPASDVMPRWLALIITFLVCGSLHDLVTLLVRGSTQFLFTLWFFFFSIGILIGEVAGLDIAGLPTWLRAAIHIGYLSICLFCALSMQRLF